MQHTAYKADEYNFEWLETVNLQTLHKSNLTSGKVMRTCWW
jgi:hypothetical protein